MSEHASRMLPADHETALLVGRMQLADGPTPVVLRGGKLTTSSQDRNAGG